MHRRSKFPGLVSLLVAVAAICIGASGVAAAPVVRGNVQDVAIPVLGPGSNFSREAYAEGARDAPGVLAKMNIACTVRQAVFAGNSSLLDSSGKTIGHAKLYEVACVEGLGYLLNLREQDAPVAFDCIRGAQSGRIACMLPLNAHPAGGLDPSLKAAGVECQAEQARYIGQDLALKLRRYEVSCGEGFGYVLDIPLADGSGPSPKTTPCFEAEEECHLTSHVENVVMLAYQAGKKFGSDCHISDARYVGFVAAHDTHLYEVSCQAGHDGELIEVDRIGGLKSHIECSKIKLVGATCKLRPGEAVDPRIVEAEGEGARPAPQPGAAPDVLTNPDWVQRPGGDTMARVYPDRAQRTGVSGRAVIDCTVAASGHLEACKVIDESPAEFGFGAAAIKASGSFRMRPLTRNGVPVSGARVRLPIVFTVRRG